MSSCWPSRGRPWLHQCLVSSGSLSGRQGWRGGEARLSLRCSPWTRGPTQALLRSRRAGRYRERCGPSRAPRGTAPGGLCHGAARLGGFCPSPWPHSSAGTAALLPGMGACPATDAAAALPSSLVSWCPGCQGQRIRHALASALGGAVCHCLMLGTGGALLPVEVLEATSALAESPCPVPAPGCGAHGIFHVCVLLNLAHPPGSVWF